MNDEESYFKGNLFQVVYDFRSLDFGFEKPS